jgi:lipopolysaccharide/colanic/teichoic acid biosynthesis glycosyltransferase
MRSVAADVPVAYLGPRPAVTEADLTWSYTPGWYERFLKPALDIVGGLVLALLAMPLMLLITVIIWITMGRPALLTQRRIGQGGRTFTLFKFRTMLPDRREQQRPFPGPDRRRLHKSPNDPRLTPVGRFLRKWSLDELPQFWNVVLGDMSLVGPRPELAEIVERHYQPWQHLRHVVKPGVTGLWQVSARSNGMMHDNTHIDLVYLDQASLLTDVKILVLTVPAALGLRRGY